MRMSIHPGAEIGPIILFAGKSGQGSQKAAAAGRNQACALINVT
jgi:hypothetical protein